MDSQSSDEPKINRVDIAIEADKLLLQINEFTSRNPGERILREELIN
jgi:hypothetical protein